MLIKQRQNDTRILLILVIDIIFTLLKNKRTECQIKEQEKNIKNVKDIFLKNLKHLYICFKSNETHWTMI